MAKDQMSQLLCMKINNNLSTHIKQFLHVLYYKNIVNTMKHHNSGIDSKKCQSFNSFMEMYKQQNHLNYNDTQHVINLTVSNYYVNPQKCNKYIPGLIVNDVKSNRKSADTIGKIIKKQEKKKININVSVNNISDLLNVISANPYSVDCEYNIDLKMLHSIKDELTQLNSMVGIHSLKTALLDQLLYYIQGFHLLDESGDFKHTVLYGPPGSGKTEIAQILGKMYSKMGVIQKPPPPTQPTSTASCAANDFASIFGISKKEEAKYACTAFKKVTRADLVAGYLGQTALKTRSLINECLGGVIFLDEAYSLGSKEGGDSFSKECVDTLCESLSNHKKHLMFIIAGYEKELTDGFFALNPGLNSRFVWRFNIDNYTYTDLWQIFELKVKQSSGWSLHPDITNSVGEIWFKQHFNDLPGLGRDVETLLFKTKICHSRRIYGAEENIKYIITMDDINKGMVMLQKHQNEKSKKEAAEKLRMYNSLYA